MTIKQLNITFFYLLFLAPIYGTNLSGQSVQPSPLATALPTGPLISKHAPEYASWTVMHSVLVPENKSVSGKETEDQKYQFIQKGTDEITKTQSLRHIRKIAENEKDLNIWIMGDREVIKRPEWSSPYIISEIRSLNNPYPVDFSATDFPGCQWISSANFKGIQKINGKDYMLFEEGMPEYSPKKKSTDSDQDPLAIYKCKKSAYVDLLTRLPLMIKIDDDIMSYNFGTTPSSMLVYPPDIKQFVDSWDKMRARETSMPPPP